MFKVIELSEGKLTDWEGFICETEKEAFRKSKELKEDSDKDFKDKYLFPVIEI